MGERAALDIFILNAPFSFTVAAHALDEPKPMQPFRGIFVKRQGCGAAFPNADAADQCIFKRPGPISERNRSLIDFLLVLHLKAIGRQDHLDVLSNLAARALVQASKNPDDFENTNEAYETGIPRRQLAFNHVSRLGGLHRIVLRQIAQKDVGIEGNYFLRRNRMVAPVSIA
jgi:hypothetical protein